MEIQKENNLIQEAFEVEADEVGFCLDQKWGDYENPYENSDTALAFNLFKKGWQAAKAQAVPEGFGDIQSWIAVNSFSALDASIVDFPVVDANELAEFIDSLNIDVAVPEGFVLVKKELPEQIAEKMAIDRIDKPRHENDPVWREIAEQSYKDQVKSKKWEFWRDYKAMIEAQEQSHE